MTVMKYLTLPIELIEKVGEFYTPHLIAHDPEIGDFVNLDKIGDDVLFQRENPSCTIFVVLITSSYEFYFHDV
jgi:hypothetical protein